MNCPLVPSKLQYAAKNRGGVHLRLRIDPQRDEAFTGNDQMSESLCLVRPVRRDLKRHSRRQRMPYRGIARLIRISVCFKITPAAAFKHLVLVRVEPVNSERSRRGYSLQLEKSSLRQSHIKNVL